MGDVSNNTANVTIYDELGDQLGNNTNPWVSKDKQGTSPALTTVNASVTSVTVLAANTARVEATITNNSTAILYVALGATSATTAYSYKLFQDDTLIIDKYSGVISGIWASATGAAQVTEVS